MKASLAFGLTELARVNLDGEDFVLYDDGQLADAIPAREFDDVPVEFAAHTPPKFRTIDGEDNQDAIDAVKEHNVQRYSLWCSQTMTVNEETLERILLAAGIDAVNSGAHGRVEAASLTIALIQPDGRTTTHNPAGKVWTLEELQSLVGGYIEPLWLENGQVAIVNEDGRLKGLAENPTATVRADRGLAHGQGLRHPLVGPVAFGAREVIR